VLQTGQIVLADTAQALLKSPLMREAYLGELTDLTASRAMRQLSGEE
jgi:hypothetical protein